MDSEKNYMSVDLAMDSDFVSRMMSSDSVFSFVDPSSARVLDRVSISDRRYAHTFTRQHVHKLFDKIANKLINRFEIIKTIINT